MCFYSCYLDATGQMHCLPACLIAPPQSVRSLSSLSTMTVCYIDRRRRRKDTLPAILSSTSEIKDGNRGRRTTSQQKEHGKTSRRETTLLLNLWQSFFPHPLVPALSSILLPSGNGLFIVIDCHSRVHPRFLIRRCGFIGSVDAGRMRRYVIHYYLVHHQHLHPSRRTGDESPLPPTQRRPFRLIRSGVWE